jgi:hypothetical protein
MAITICFAAQDPPSGRVVITKVEGRGKVHLANEGRTGALCGVSLDGMTSGWVRGELDTDHSDLCTRCLKKSD